MSEKLTPKTREMSEILAALGDLDISILDLFCSDAGLIREDIITVRKKCKAIIDKVFESKNWKAEMNWDGYSDKDD